MIRFLLFVFSLIYFLVFDKRLIFADNRGRGEKNI